MVGFSAGGGGKHGGDGEELQACSECSSFWRWWPKVGKEGSLLRGTCEGKLLEGVRGQRSRQPQANIPGAGRQEESGSCGGMSQEACSAIY